MSQLPEGAAAQLRGTRAQRSGRRGTTWLSVRDQILVHIRSGEWAAGSLIPTEKQLAADWGCARATVNRALTDLAEAGIVERRRKVGTRVNGALTADARHAISAMRSDIQAAGATYGYRLCQHSEVRIGHDIASRLQLRNGDQVTAVCALFLADDKPYCVQETWLNTRVMAKPAAGAFDAVSADEWLADVAPPNRGRMAILARAISSLCAEAMAVPAGTVLLTVEQTDWSDSTPLAFSRRYYRQDHRLVYDD